MVDRRYPIGEDDIIYRREDDDSISAYSEDFSDESSAYEFDGSSSCDENEGVTALFNAFENAYQVMERTPTEASFLAALEKRMARNALRDQNSEEDEDDNDSVALTRRRGVPAIRVVADEERAVELEDDTDNSVYMAPLAGDDEQTDEEASTPQTRQLPKPRRLFRSLPRSQGARLQF